VVKAVGVEFKPTGVSSMHATAKYGDVAYVPGTGPVGKTCDDCCKIVHSRGAKISGRCQAAAALRFTDLTEVGYIVRSTPACKYFVQREEGDRPWAWFKRDRGRVGDAGSGDGAAAD